MDFGSSIVKHTPKRKRQTRSGLQPSKVLDPQLVGLGKSYFGIDLEQLREMSVDEMADIADRAEASEEFLGYLEILKDHVKTVITNQGKAAKIEAEIQKLVNSTAKSIDNNKASSAIAGYGYKAHVKTLGNKVSSEFRLIDAETSQELRIQRIDFGTRLRMLRSRNQRKEEEIRNKPTEQLVNEQVSEAQRQAKQDRNNRVKKGNRFNRSLEDLRRRFR